MNELDGYKWKQWKYKVYANFYQLLRQLSFSVTSKFTIATEDLN